MYVRPHTQHHSGTHCEEGGNTYNNNNTQRLCGGRWWVFPFTLPVLRAKRLSHCQMDAIIVIVVMLEVAVAGMTVVGLVGLATLSLYLILNPIAMPPPPSIFNIIVLTKKFALEG